MSDRTSLLFALPGFRVLDVSVGPVGGRQVLAESVETEGGCRSCGVVSWLVKDRPVCRVKDLQHGVVALRVSVRKRRFVCAEQLCARRSFTRVCDQLPARARLTARLRTKVAAVVVTTNRAVSEVGAEYDLARATVHRILVAAAVVLLAPPELTTTIGIGETRTRRVRWVLVDTVWRRSDPWMTSIVDQDPAGPGGVIGLAPGRTGACVVAWLALQSKEFRDDIAVVAIDPSAPYTAGIRRALPNAVIVLDHFHPGALGQPGGHRSPPTSRS